MIRLSCLMQFFSVHGRKASKYLLVKIFVLLVCSNALLAENLKFNHLSSVEGLPDNSVRAIAQDGQGYLWFGTETGLAKYDGFSFEIYHSDSSNAHSLASSYVVDLTSDIDGNIWIAGNKGLNKYNRSGNNFELFTHDDNNNESLSSNQVTALERDGSKGIWVGHSLGIDRYSAFDNQFKRYRFPKSITNSKSINVRAIHTPISNVVSNSIFVGSNLGFHQLDLSSGQFNPIVLPVESQPTIRAIAADKSGRVWLASKQGLFYYSLKDQSVKKFNFANRTLWFGSILIDQEGNIWVGTFQQGIFRIDSDNLTVINYKPDSGDALSISDRSVLSLFQDHSQMIWIGTYNQGIDSFNPNELALGSYNFRTSGLKCMSSSDIRSSLLLADNSILLGTIDGLARINLDKKSCLMLQHVSETAQHVKDITVYSIFLDNDSGLWIGTSRGLELVSVQDGKSRLVLDIGGEAVYDIKKRGNTLVLATDKGIHGYELARKELKRLTTYEVAVNQLALDTNQQLWAATDNGLLQVTENEVSEIAFSYSGKNLKNLDGTINAIHIDSKNNLWLAIEGSGLYRFQINSSQLKPIGRQLGLSFAQGFSSLCGDSNGNIWVATSNQGLFRLNMKTLSYNQLTVSDGLIDNVYNFNACTLFDNERLIFGSKSGFNLFKPMEVSSNSESPLVSLKDFKLFGNSVDPKKDYQGFKLDKHISTVNKLTLTHRESVFGFDFLATHYLSADTIKYSYMLEGFDHKWTEATAQNRGVTYNNISPGEYTFRLKAKTKDNIWSEKNIALPIQVLPAPWKTWWAYCLYIMLVFFSIAVFIRGRTRFLQRQAEKLSKNVKDKTKELVQEKEKVEQLLSQKNEEFANVSHEFRTPLTLIMGPLKQLIGESEKPKQLHRLNIIQRNGHRLLRMVDQLLSLETFRVKSIVEKSSQPIGKILDLLVQAFEDLANEKKITITLHNRIDIYFQFTADAFETIIVNLLSNAIKYTGLGGKIDVFCERKDNLLEIKVVDTGRGIPKDKLEVVFERYSRVLDANSEQVTGAGIGLSLVKKLVENHQGEITLDSKVGIGTCIKIQLPIVNEVAFEDIDQSAHKELVAMELLSITTQEPSQNRLASQPVEQHSDKPLLLVIEDNVDMLHYIVENMYDDYNILTAANGEQGVNIAIEQVPDLIISDIMMPKKDGYQTANALRKNRITNHIPIILLTARGDRESRLKGWYERADEYITKPFDVEELKIRLINLLEIRSILKSRFSEVAFASSISAENFQSDKNEETLQNSKTQKHLQFVKELNKVLEKLHHQSGLTIPEIATANTMSERQFFRKVKSVLDMTPLEYLRRFRLEKAKCLIQEGKSIGYSGYEVGFASQSHFGKCFKAQFGCSPVEFKERMQQ